MKRMSQLSGIADPGYKFEVWLVLTKKAYQLRRCLVGKAKDNPVIDLVFGSVSSNTAEDWETGFRELIDGCKIAVFHVGPDAFFCGGKVSQMAFYVAFDAEGQVDKGFSSANAFTVSGQRFA